MNFSWHKETWRHGKGVHWHLKLDCETIGSCFYLPGSKRWLCKASAPVEGGVILCEYYGGTASSARKALECDWDRRSIGLFKADDIYFSNA